MHKRRATTPNRCFFTGCPNTATVTLDLGRVKTPMCEFHAKDRRKIMLQNYSGENGKGGYMREVK